MKRKSLLFVWSYVFILSTIFISCKDTDNSVFGDDFDFPVLTDANTIRFTVNVTGDWRQLNIVADGGRMVIDWGNGRMQKVEVHEVGARLTEGADRCRRRSPRPVSVGCVPALRG